jgi:hypothetical protein
MAHFRGARRGIRLVWVEAALAAAAFAVLCTVVLSVAPQLGVEPDDGAYRASIVAMTEGDFLTLSTAQAETLARRLGDNPAAPPNQWVELHGGRNISEKDPGYPFLAAPFQALGIIRWAPLFFGALACLGCSSAPGAGSGGSAAWWRWACIVAHPGRRCCSPGAITCRRSPTPR